MLPLTTGGGEGEAMGKAHRSAISGRFVKGATARRHPKTTVTQSTGSKANGHRSAITGRFVKAATARRHPDTTIREGG
jgi:hypothetical protein